MAEIAIPIMGMVIPGVMAMETAPIKAILDLKVLDRGLAEEDIIQVHVLNVDHQEVQVANADNYLNEA